MDGNEHEPTDVHTEDRRDTHPDGRSEKPISFDFKLRLGSRESTASLTGRATGELVQLQPIDWDSFTGLRDDDAPREYKTDGDLPSIIVELANQIAGPDTLAQAAVRMNALANSGVDDRIDAGMDAGVDPGYGPPPVPDIAVATVDDDPMLSAVVGKILDEPDEATVMPAPMPAPVAAPAPVPAPEPAPTPPVSAVAPAVRAPVQPVEEGPIELPRIVALTPDLPSGEVAQPPITPASVPAQASVPAAPSDAVAAPITSPPQMLTGAEALAIAATPAPAAIAPMHLGPMPIAPLQLAKIERRPGAERPTKPVDFHALLGEAGMHPAPPKRRKKRHPIRALFKLVVVLAIIGGGLFFGKKYVLDMRWSGDLKPFADAVADARQLKWDKPVDVKTLPIAEYSDHVVASVLGPDANQRALGAEWRAMGLLEGDLDLDTVGQYSAGFRPVMYDPIDQTIYELENLPVDLREFYLDQAMGAALLDQHFHWSEGLATLGRAERNGRMALIEADAAATTWAILDPSDRDIEKINSDGQNLRDNLGIDIGGAVDYPTALLVGPGEEARNLFTDGVLESVAERDTIIEKSVANDAAVLDDLRGLSAGSDQIGATTDNAGMVYWYYVLASRLAAPEAWNAAVAWDGDETIFDSTADGDCVSATISTVDEPGRQLLLGALQRWAAAAPPEATTTVAELGTERIQVHSCDPGAAADTKVADGIQLWGLADAEYALVSDESLSRDADARSCSIIAFRNFGVAAQVLSGDTEGAKTVSDQILASCSGA